MWISREIWLKVLLWNKHRIIVLNMNPSKKLYLKDQNVECETLKDRIKTGEFIEVMEFE